VSQYDLPRKVKTERIELKAPPTGPTATAPLPAVRGDPRGLTSFIQETARKYGIDPATALKVAKSEGLAQFYGDNGRSGGAFQLFTGGGLGNEFKKETGLDPLDPANEKATIDYALKRAAQGGWGPWYGAAKVGVGTWDGIGDRPATASATAPPAIASATPTPFTDPAANTETASAKTEHASVSTTTPGEDATVAEDKEKDKKEKDYRGIAGDAFSDIGKIFADGPVARNARTASGPANVPIPSMPVPQAPIPMIDTKHVEMQRQQLALAMQRLNSGKLV